VDTSRPFVRTNRTRLVPSSVLTGHVCTERQIDALDTAGCGRVDRRRFLAAVRRAGGRAGGRAGDPGAALLGKLRELDVSLNPLASLAGLERLGALRVLTAAGTGVGSLDDLSALRTLPLLERVDLSGCPVCDPAPSLKDAGCFRLRAIQRLSPPQAQCKLVPPEPRAPSPAPCAPSARPRPRCCR
jgi:hypothetical protein